jgi:hypothetical protein
MLFNISSYLQFKSVRNSPITCPEGTEGEYRYSSSPSLTSALDVGGWLTPRHSCFTPRECNLSHTKCLSPFCFYVGTEGTFRRVATIRHKCCSYLCPSLTLLISVANVVMPLLNSVTLFGLHFSIFLFFDTLSNLSTPTHAA